MSMLARSARDGRASPWSSAKAQIIDNADAVTADRGYGQASVERGLHDLGVRSVAIPRTSKPTAARRAFEHRRAFREKVKWRTGSEGRINHIKRSYGWNRTELTGINGVRTWCGHGVFAQNLVKIGALAA